NELINGPPTSNVPSTVKAYVAPLKESAPAFKPPQPKYAKAVFMAEKVMAAGNAWHKACFTCKICNKRLDSHTLRERENDVYCHHRDELVRVLSLSYLLRELRRRTVHTCNGKITRFETLILTKMKLAMGRTMARRGIGDGHRRKCLRGKGLQHLLTFQNLF
ncbi:Cysteine and glycine-rich protein 1, partial [Armadillidium vulgare]